MNPRRYLLLITAFLIPSFICLGQEDKLWKKQQKAIADSLKKEIKAIAKEKKSLDKELKKQEISSPKKEDTPSVDKKKKGLSRQELEDSLKRVNGQIAQIRAKNQKSETELSRTKTRLEEMRKDEAELASLMKVRQEQKAALTAEKLHEAQTYLSKPYSQMKEKRLAEMESEITALGESRDITNFLKKDLPAARKNLSLYEQLGKVMSEPYSSETMNRLRAEVRKSSLNEVQQKEMEERLGNFNKYEQGIIAFRKMLTGMPYDNIQRKASKGTAVGKEAAFSIMMDYLNKAENKANIAAINCIPYLKKLFEQFKESRRVNPAVTSRAENEINEMK